MTCNAGDKPIVLDEFDYFSDKINPAVLDPSIADLTLDKGAGCSVIDGDFDPAGQVIALWKALRDPLDFTTPFVAIFVDDADGRIVAVGIRTVDG